jgi:hypothetical protein
MSDFPFSYPGCITGKKQLSATDIDMLRDCAFPGGLRSIDDVAILITLNNACPDKCGEWASFFVESLTDFIVFHSYPQGSVDELNADWLARTVAPGGVVHTSLELALLLRVIELSSFVPVSLSVLALDQLRLAMTTSDGAYASERECGNSLTAADIVYIEKILRAPIGQVAASLRSAEISVLKAINSVSLQEANHSGWRSLLKAIDRLEQKPERSAGEDWLKISDDILLEGFFIAA